MSSPVTTSLRDQALVGAVVGGVVGDAVLPAAPDHSKPRSGQDAHGVGVAVASGARLVVEVGGPGVGVAGVAGEVHDGLAQLLVAGEPEGDGLVLAGLAGGRRRPGQAFQRGAVGEALAAVAQLGQQGRGPDPAGAGQAGEDVAVGVGAQPLDDLAVQLVDLGADGLQGGDQAAGDRGAGICFGAGQPVGRVQQALVQLGGGGPAAVADAAQEPAKAGLGEPGGPLGRGEAAKEGQRDRAVDLGEQAGRAGEGDLQVGAQLVGQGDAVVDQLLAGAADRPQPGGLRAVGAQRVQPVAVGAQHVGQQVGVEAVVLVAGRPVPSPQVLDLAAWDHDHLEPGVQQGLDDRAVGPLDRHPADLQLGQASGQAAQVLAGVGHLETGADLPVGVQHAHHVQARGPVQPGQPGWCGSIHADPFRCGGSGRGRLHPPVPGRRGRRLTDRRLRARGPVAAQGVPGRRASLNSSWPSQGKPSWRWPDGHREFSSILPASSAGRVHQ